MFLILFLHFSWKDAENECTKNNDHLTSVLSRYEQAYIFSSLPFENKCVLIGLYSQDRVHCVTLFKEYFKIMIVLPFPNHIQIPVNFAFSWGFTRFCGQMKQQPFTSNG